MNTNLELGQTVKYKTRTIAQLGKEWIDGGEIEMSGKIVSIDPELEYCLLVKIDFMQSVRIRLEDVVS